MFFKKAFLEEPRLRSAGWRYGFLAVIIALIIGQLVVAIHFSPSYPNGRFFGFVAPFMLLFNHLAFSFRWSRLTTVCMRCVAYAWLIFGLAYIFVMLTR